MKPLSRSKQGFLYAAPFLGLGAFKVWISAAGTGHLMLPAALVLLGYCALMLFLARRWDKPTYLDLAVSAYFGLLVVFLLLWPETAESLLARYPVTGIYACIFAAAFLPPLLGMDPFTYHYARKYSPPAVWETSIFININRIMTHVWAGIFAVCVVLSLYPSLAMRAVIPLALILGFGLPFNLRFPDYYLRRLGLPSLKEQKRMEEEGKPRMSPPQARRTDSRCSWHRNTRSSGIFPFLCG